LTIWLQINQGSTGGFLKREIFSRINALLLWRIHRADALLPFGTNFARGDFPVLQRGQLSMITLNMQNFLADLIQAGFETRAERFKQTALVNLGKLIPFDAALWISGRTRDRTVHNFHVIGLPRSMMDSWEQIKHQDRLFSEVVANPGVTIDTKDLYSRMERQESEVYQKHSKQYGIEAAICTALPDPDVGLFEGISLYRRSADPGFSQSERQNMQSLFPLLSRVWRHNQIQQLKLAGQEASPTKAAICDNQGWLRHAEDGFVDMLRAEFPDWQPPELPGGLRAWFFGPDGSDFFAKSLEISRRQQDDLILLQVRRRSALAVLTQREQQVTEWFAAGLTYKEIATELGLSASTVRRHLESIYYKLEVSSKAELIQLVHQRYAS
jgi:DNA-binding CsgD family transcriptional regulator